MHRPAASPLRLPWGEPVSFALRVAARLIDGVLLAALTFAAFDVIVGVLFATGGSLVRTVFVLPAWELLPLATIVIYRLTAEGGRAGQALGKAWCASG